jgi:hypothetical protein
MRRCASAILLLCLLGWLPAAAAEPRRKSAVEELASIWISACLDGQLQLSADGIREVSELKGYWERQGRWERAHRHKNSRYFKVLQPVEAALIITDYEPPTHEGFKSSCELLVRNLNLEPSWRPISSAVGGKPIPTARGMHVFTIDNKPEGYRIEIYPAVLSIGHYTDKIVEDARARGTKPTVSAEE